MLRTDRPAVRRPGFTLVELLVVIAIIAILVGLTTAAAQKFRDRGRELQAINDLKQMESVLSTFRQKYGVLPPCFGGGADGNGNIIGTFRLCTVYPTGVSASGGTDDWPEVQFLLKMFPRMSRMDNGLRYGGLGGTVVQSTAPIHLDPNQILVFFLSGGSFTGYTGFATDPTQPFAPPTATAAARKDGGALMDFPAGQRVKPSDYAPKKSGNPSWYQVSPSATRFQGDKPSQGQDEPWFVDPWGNPYLYLSTSVGGDYPFNQDYQNAVLPAALLAALQQPLQIGPWGGNATFNSSGWKSPPSPLTAPPYGPTPYYESRTQVPNSNPARYVAKYVNPKTFQIISMGKDGLMGRGGLWRSTNAGDYEENRVGGGDDFANFADKRLGSAIQDQ
jgi:prepilin-type N-terminal cleavage/methylation domain-containing protein